MNPKPVLDLKTIVSDSRKYGVVWCGVAWRGESDSDLFMSSTLDSEKD
jgi:hypothetical protein